MYLVTLPPSRQFEIHRRENYHGFYSAHPIYLSWGRAGKKNGCRFHVKASMAAWGYVQKEIPPLGSVYISPPQPFVLWPDYAIKLEATRQHAGPVIITGSPCERETPATRITISVQGDDYKITPVFLKDVAHNE